MKSHPVLIFGFETLHLIIVLYSEMDEQDKKEKMDTRRSKAGCDTRKLYEVMLMKEIPGN